MESSEEEADFPSHEWITPQSKINSIYQSLSEKGIRRLCTELLELKDSVDNLCGNLRAKYMAFLRISEEVIEVEQELMELQKYVSAQGILVQDLMSGVCRELEIWNSDNSVANQDEQFPDSGEVDSLLRLVNDPNTTFLETIDVLLAECKLDEALSKLEEEEKSNPVFGRLGDTPEKGPPFVSEFHKRKATLATKFSEIAQQASVGSPELRRTLSGLFKLGNGSSAQDLLLKCYSTHLEKNIERFLPSCSLYLETYSATLSHFVFQAISNASTDSSFIFGQEPSYIRRHETWIESELQSFVKLVKEKAPPSEDPSALRAAAICLQCSLRYCSSLEKQGFRFSQHVLDLLKPHLEEVLDLNFRRAKSLVELAGSYEIFTSSSSFPSYYAETPGEILLTSSGKQFMCIVQDIVEHLTVDLVSHFGGTILSRLGELSDVYIGGLTKTLPCPSEDDGSIEHKGIITLKAETDEQQLALIANAFTVADELLPMVVFKICYQKAEGAGSGTGVSSDTELSPGKSTELKEWRRNLQHSLDKLRDHFCRQYVLNFIYCKEGKTKLDSRSYINGEANDLYWEPEPMPSLPFQELFAKLQEFAIVAGDILVGMEKVQKILLARLTETVLMWVLNEQSFWEVFEDDSSHLKPFGLQQFILDMHFIIEIAKFGGYLVRHAQQIANSIIERAISTFSAKGVDVQGALAEDEWFVDTAKTAIGKLLMGTSDSSEADEHIHIIENSDSDVTNSTSLHSAESFTSAKMEEAESPYFTDSEA